MKIKLPFAYLIIVGIAALLYYFSYYFPFTNNAFVMANVRPIAADVGGYITAIYVKNGEYVKKGHPLFKVFQAPYQWAYKKASADLLEAKAQLVVIQKKIEKTAHAVQAQREIYQRRLLDYQHFASALQDKAVSKISVQDLSKDKNAALSTLLSLQKELELEKKQLIVQKHHISSLTAIKGNAKVNLDETIVYAQNNGTIQNMYLSLGTPIQLRKPIFSFVDTDNLYIQANFFETDLRFVKPGSKALIIPRTYFGAKVYHGVVMAKTWTVNRQFTDNRSQQQNIDNNEYNWFILPQRLPVEIKITDYDPVNFPLSMGSSAYVYISV